MKGERTLFPAKTPLFCAILPMALVGPIPVYVEPILCKADSQVSNKYFFFPEHIVSCCFMS